MAGFYFLIDSILKDIRPRYLEAVEESLNDTANLLATEIELHMRNDEIHPAFLERSLNETRARVFRARIYGITKTHANIDVYVTDHRGIVLFDSSNQDTGKDFSHWNDVARTLHGEYGARSSRSDPADPSSGALYVSAPIRHKGKIVGVLTVVKSKDSVTPFMELARRKFIQAGILAASGMILLVLLLSLWVTAPIERLRRHVLALRESPEADIPLPRLGGGEVAALGRAFEEMRGRLKSREYIERYVQSLTHELKSPLAAIRGSAELLQGRLKARDRARFLKHIETESARVATIVQKMLDLVSLESRSVLRNPEAIDMRALLAEILRSVETERRAKRLKFLQSEIGGKVECTGERFLLRQAIENIIRNALDFAPIQSTIRIGLSFVAEPSTIVLTVEDEGPGIPDYALPRVFDRFYSLARPDGRKGTGLGLPFVREVLALHGGGCELISPSNERTGHGTKAILKWANRP